MSTRLGAAFVAVDVTNPGQFFACCGLLELAHRLWPGVEAWFEDVPPRFALATAEGAPVKLDELLGRLHGCPIVGLSEQEQPDLAPLRAPRTLRRRVGRAPDPSDKERRKAPGTRARSGTLSFGTPFDLTLDWWLHSTKLKTWSGQQKDHLIVRATQQAIIHVQSVEQLFNFTYAMRTTSGEVMEPFGFDARRPMRVLDTGWSLDEQQMEIDTHPAVELLCLIGLQRFQPMAGERSWRYQTWAYPLGITAVTSIATGSVPFPGSQPYQFSTITRVTGQGYKAFRLAIQKENEG